MADAKVPASKSIYGDEMTREEIEAARKRQKERMAEAKRAVEKYLRKNKLDIGQKNIDN